MRAGALAVFTHHCLPRAYHSGWHTAVLRLKSLMKVRDFLRKNSIHSEHTGAIFQRVYILSRASLGPSDREALNVRIANVIQRKAAKWRPLGPHLSSGTFC